MLRSIFGCQSAGITHGRIFRCVSKKERVWGDGITERGIWHVVKESARRAAIGKLSPH
jgi:site-specific recombinase XerD